MPFLQKAVTLPRDLKSIFSNLDTQHEFLHQHIKPVTSQYMESNDGSLDEADIQKIFSYYGLAVPAILGEAFCLLRGVPISEKERFCSTAQGAMTGLFDDFFDKQFLEEESIKKAVNETIHLNRNSNEQLFSWFYQKVLETSPNADLIKQRLSSVYHAQVESKKQTAGKLTEDQLLSITLQKGSSSLLFYYSAFQENEQAIETGVIAELGGWMQLANDIFDVYKDREAGIQTLATTCSQIRQLKSLFENGVKAGYANALKLPFPKKNIQLFLNRFSIGIFSRCMVCLDQLERNQQFSNGRFEVEKYSRKQLICDMDTAGNKFRSVLKHLQL